MAMTMTSRVHKHKCIQTHTHTHKLTSRQARQLKPFNGDASSPLLCTWNERRARDNQPNRTLVFNYCGHFNWTEPIHAVTYINTHTHTNPMELLVFGHIFRTLFRVSFFGLFLCLPFWHLLSSFVLNLVFRPADFLVCTLVCHSEYIDE